MINIFKRWFSHSEEQVVDDYQNPWAGLASYEDPETAERKLKFCGRDDDSYDLARLIMGNVFVTLYGKSGIGKTSLLNAGVFPELREEHYTPVSLRLGIRDEKHPQSYQTIIVEAVERIVKRTETINVIDEQQDQQSIDYLWNYFARRRFYNKYDELTNPVIVFDQFEEVFRAHRDEAEILLRQLDYLNDKDHTLDSCEVDGQPYRYEQNFRFVVSIREDDLYRLEDSIDNCFLPALKRCRYRLRSLSEQNATAVILIPGEGLFKEENQKCIVDSIIDIARNKEDKSISTNVLSLICSRIFVDFQKSGVDYISPSLVESFIKGNPFERFYNEATHNFSNREKAFIERHLVDSSTGRRDSISENDFLLNVKNGSLLMEGKNRILQRISTSSDGRNWRVELIHDSFCEPLIALRSKREKWRRIGKNAFVVGFVLLVSTFCYALFQLHQVKEANWKTRENHARFVSEKAIALVDEGDSYLASLLSLEILPNEIENPNRPFVIEAEHSLRQANANENAILRGHTDIVRCANFSPDGMYIVSASADKTIRIWETNTGKCLMVLKGHTECVNTAEFSPDGKYIVSASADKTIRVWETATGKCILLLKGHTWAVISAAFSPDGKYIVSASADETVSIWEFATGKQIGKLVGHSFYLSSVAYSPDGQRILYASLDKTVRIWDASTTKQIGQPLDVNDYVNSAVYSPDGHRIVTASYSNISLWNANTGQLMMSLEGHTSMVNYATFSPDGKYIVSASDDKSIKIWDVTSGNCLHSLSGHTNSVFYATFSPDCTHILSSSADNTIRLWEINTKQEVGISMDGFINCAKFSPDGQRIVSASSDNTIYIWDTQTGKQIGNPLKGHTGSVNFVAFSPDGKRIVSASDDNTICIWDAQTGDQIGYPLQGHTGSVNSVTFSPDGKRIVSASDDKTIHIWDVQTGRQIGNPLKGHTASVLFAAFSSDNQHIVSSSVDNTIRIWDANYGREIGLPLEVSPITSFSFSHDGRYIVLAFADYSIRIWDANSFKQVGLSMDGHVGLINSICFSKDDSQIISASDDNTIRIWDVPSGQVLLVLKGHNDVVTSADFSPDGKQIVSSSKDCTIKVWAFPSLQELIDKTRERFKNRQLTPEERRKYYLE